ncbi:MULTISPECIES: hypothetical protein [Mesorhizobium]|uniref:Bacterial OB-fold domain-containing protein n=1 Tax=Mesorhizobium denitrificans TaxID=2294114 RepID=A0A371X3U3_9HYPH|nr:MULTISPECIES: hypothetical protein [Mesorhizobium]RFC63892.1 hypothetical protein DY251_20260 [Mesorhizobium denitrificans]
MSDQDNTNATSGPETSSATPPVKKSVRGKVLGGSALVGVLLVGAVAGAFAMKMSHRDERQALLPPVAINAMADDSLVAVKGKVSEIFGNKFIIADSSGRALIDVGPAGDDKSLVAQNEEVTVQGRFDDGFVRAGMVIHTDGRVDELRPPHPHGPRHGWRDFGPGGRDRPDGEMAPPAPPRT